MNAMAGSSSSAEEEPQSSGGEQPAESSLRNAAASSYAQQNHALPAGDLQLPLPSTRLEGKPAESHEQKKIITTGYIPPGHSVSRVHRPVATQPDQATTPLPPVGGGGPPPPGGGGGGGGGGLGDFQWRCTIAYFRGQPLLNSPVSLHSPTLQSTHFGLRKCNN